MKIRVESPARLHLGIIDMRGSSGRKYGSFGLALDYPLTVVEVAQSGDLVVSGNEKDRAVKFAEMFFKAVKVEGGAEIKVLSTPPPHSGFGSGTQLALAIGTALSRLYDIDLDLLEIARIMGRGKVSGVGVYAFRYGGFILDGGHKNHDIPPLIFRHEIPEDWYVVVGVPEIERVWGDEEKKLMNLVSEKGLDTSERISKIVLMNLLPAIVERDFEEFISALERIDFEVGKSFSVAQSGVVRHELIQEGIELLRDLGAGGCGQSSWGPAFYGFVKGKSKAKKISNALGEFISEKAGGMSFYTDVRNRSAEVHVYE